MGVGQKTHMFKDGGATLGACCNYAGGGTSFCFNTTSAACAAGGGSYSGDGVYCGDSGICASPLDCCGVVGASGCGFTCGGTGASACSCNDCGVPDCWDCTTVTVAHNVFSDDVGPACSCDFQFTKTFNVIFDVSDITASVCVPNVSNNTISWATSVDGREFRVVYDLDNALSGQTASNGLGGWDNLGPWSVIIDASAGGPAGWDPNATDCNFPLIKVDCSLSPPAQWGTKANKGETIVKTNTCTSYESQECMTLSTGCVTNTGSIETITTISLACSP